MAGKVLVDGTAVTKAGAAVGAQARIEVRNDARFVSRGGVKLERALDEFDWAVSGLACLDVGASSGGFTDCLLQRGASGVTALDVGYGQIAWALRTDPRVRVIERCNFRLADAAAIGAPFAFVSADVSFISLTILGAKFRETMAANGRLVALVKPQFEAGKSAVGRGGVVREPSVHVAAIEAVDSAFRAEGLTPVRLTFSPITGPAGNIEFLIGVTAEHSADRIDAAGVVAAAHEALAQ